tara:strand:+ start:315 stop:2669 length:2355 start_codon:yes stop_codon:yes gene_type:complete
MVEFNSQQKYTILNKLHGYSGSPQSDEMEAFIMSSPAASATLRKFDKHIKKTTFKKSGGLIKGYSTGGLEEDKPGFNTGAGRTFIGEEGIQEGLKFDEEDIIKAGVGLADEQEGMDINKDGKVTSSDALAYAKMDTAKDKATEGAGVLAMKAMTDPSALVEKQKVDTIDVDATGTNLTETTYNADGTVKEYGVGARKSMTDDEKISADDAAAGTATAGKATAATTDAPSTETTYNEDGTVKEQGFDVTTIADADIAKTKEDIKAQNLLLKDTKGQTGEGFEDGLKTKSTMDAATAKVDEDGKIVTEVSDIDAATGTSVDVDAPDDRKLKETTYNPDGSVKELGETVDLDSIKGRAEKAAEYTEAIQEETASPSEKTSVAYQMGQLTDNFDAKNPPPWAAGALRGVMAQMSARGLSASSMTGQALVQAALESALPIASADAATQAKFESQNLSNKQARAMLAAEQRAQFLNLEFTQDFQARVTNAAKVSEVANLNFTAEQQIALENSRAANTMELANLTNEQAVVMGELAQIANLESTNLSNAQAAAKQNAEAFLDLDMKEFDSTQANSVIKHQTAVQSILTDAAQENATEQFNATSENQGKQFITNLKTQVAMANTAQENAIAQTNAQLETQASIASAAEETRVAIANAAEENAVKKYNMNVSEARETANAANAVVIAQANAVWRQNAETLDTAAQNDANKTYAQEITNLNNKAIDEIWQRERDVMDQVNENTESSKDRALNVLLGDQQVAMLDSKLEFEDNKNATSFLTELVFDTVKTAATGT